MCEVGGQSFQELIYLLGLRDPHSSQRYDASLTLISSDFYLFFICQISCLVISIYAGCADEPQWVTRACNRWWCLRRIFKSELGTAFSQGRTFQVENRVCAKTQPFEITYHVWETLNSLVYLRWGRVCRNGVSKTREIGRATNEDFWKSGIKES